MLLPSSISPLNYLSVSAPSIIQRVGAVPMSIAGIAKEVATISVSTLLFGDELTPLNITGVAVTVCGKPGPWN